jgi:hypothetical protein
MYDAQPLEFTFKDKGFRFSSESGVFEVDREYYNIALKLKELTEFIY